MKKILITNDDGIDSDGIVRLARAARVFGEVWVVAPAEQKSAASHSITLRKGLTVEEYNFPVEGVRAFAVDGMPADCIRIGVRNIVPGKPDIVLSGINFGWNAGSDVQYSATVGAAMEAAFQGVPGVAFSEGIKKGQIIADAYLDELVGEAMNFPWSHNTILNINFPDCELSDLKGILRERTNSRESVYEDNYEATELGPGKWSYSIKARRVEQADAGTDLRALYDGYISVGVIRNLG